MTDEQKRSEQDNNAPAAENIPCDTITQPTAGPSAAVKQKPRSLFSGSYTHGIDAKGRMIVPASFREGLGDQFVIAPTMDFKAIALYPLEEWIRQQDKLEALLALDARAQRLIDQFNKYSYDGSETDAQGRLLLPQKLRAKFLGDAREVEISGAKSHIRVVDSQVGAQEDESFMRDIPDPLAFIAQLQQKHP